MTPEAFIKEIATVYGPPKTENPSRYIEIVKDTVSAFKAAELELACNELVANWTYRRWPTPAELRKFLSDAAAKVAQQQPRPTSTWERGWVWKEARRWADGWFERRGNPWLIDKAAAEGWTDSLRQAVVTMAHSCLVPSGGGEAPEDARIALSDDVMAYYRDRAESLRKGAEYQRSEHYRRKHGHQQIESSAAKWLAKRRQQSQPREGEAILAAMERSETQNG